MNFHTKKFKIWHTQNTRVVVGKYVGKRFSRLKKKITKLNESKIKKVVFSQKKAFWVKMHNLYVTYSRKNLRYV
jgi:hypothetical protein